MNPEVSVILVCRNEAAHIANCIRSVLDQFETHSHWELLLVDGHSEDGTVEIARELLEGTRVNWKLLVNDGRILATGWNLGISQAAGEFVIRPDAHATLDRGYIKKGMELLREMPDVTAVGGILITESRTKTGSMIQAALSMKTGVGNSSFRTGEPAGYKDTVVYGIYRRLVFKKVGMFNENLIRHQDTEMHYRMHQLGARFYMDPAMVARYYCRETVSGICRQMFDIGYYFAFLVREGSGGALRLRHRIPFLFYTGLTLLLLMSLLHVFFFRMLLGVLSAYLGIILIESLYRALRAGKLNSMAAVALIPMMHACYAWGTFRGFLWLLRAEKKHP